MLRLNGQRRRKGALGSAPVDAFQKHRQLSAAQRHRSAVRLGPHKTSAFQPLREQTKPVAIKPQQLHLVAAPAAKDKDVAGTGLRVEHSLHLGA